MSAQWYYARGKQQRGPVSLDEIRILLASGQLTPADLAWREGMANWAAIRTIPELADSAAAAKPGGNVSPARPGRAADAGGQPPGSASAGVDIGACLDRAWDLYMKEFGTLFGLTALMLLLTATAYYAASRVNLYAGTYLVDALVHTPLTAGLFWFYLKKVRGETAVVEDLLAGYRVAFGRFFWPLWSKAY